jgi:phosphonate transport system ATP-binding protein
VSDGHELALRAEGLWFAYREADWVLKDVSLSAPRGKITIIMGPSGTGKTTLLKILAGILIGYIPQQLGLVRNLTALENVVMGALGRCGNGRVLFGLFPRHEVERAQAALELMGIGHKINEKVFRLSGGERQRVAIARTLLQRPRVIVADEFVSDLDMELAMEILERIRRAAAQEQLTFVMSMHRQGLVREFAANVLTLREGKVVPGFRPVILQEPASAEMKG